MAKTDHITKVAEATPNTMAYVAVDKDGDEWIYITKPQRAGDGIDVWYIDNESAICLPTDSIRKLIGRELTWAAEPVKLEEAKPEVPDYPQRWERKT